MGDRAVEIVKHEFEDRLDLLFRVTGVVCKSGVLISLADLLIISYTRYLPNHHVQESYGPGTSRQRPHDSGDMA